MNIHNLNTNDYYTYIDDEKLTPLSRFIFIQMHQYDNLEDFDEYYIADLLKISINNINQEIQTLVQNGYVKRIIQDYETHYYISPTGELNNQNIYAYN